MGIYREKMVIFCCCVGNLRLVSGVSHWNWYIRYIVCPEDHVICWSLLHWRERKKNRIKIIIKGVLSLCLLLLLRVLLATSQSWHGTVHSGSFPSRSPPFSFLLFFLFETGDEKVVATSLTQFKRTAPALFKKWALSYSPLRILKGWPLAPIDQLLHPIWEP